MMFKVYPDEIAHDDNLCDEPEAEFETYEEAKSWAEDNSDDYHYGLTVVAPDGRRDSGEGLR